MIARHWSEQTLDDVQREFLAGIATDHKLVGPFLLKHGVFFNPKPPLTGIKRGDFRQCFHNSYKVVKRHGKKRGLWFAEGWASKWGPPEHKLHGVHHAWCVDAEDNVHDPTWKIGAVYFGVRFKTEFLFGEVARRIEKYGGEFEANMLDNWLHHEHLEVTLTDKPDLWKAD